MIVITSERSVLTWLVHFWPTFSVFFSLESPATCSVTCRRCVETNKEPFTSHIGIKSATLTGGLKYALATGNWGEQKKAASSKAGVSQVLSRYTFASTLSHLRRTNTPIGRDGKIAKPRQLHNTHWGLGVPSRNT